MAPFGVLLLITPQRFEKIFPVLSFGPEALEEFARHMVEYALGGMAAVAREASATRHPPAAACY
jgi:hypothetical protein